MRHGSYFYKFSYEEKHETQPVVTNDPAVSLICFLSIFIKKIAFVYKANGQQNRGQYKQISFRRICK